MLKWTCVAGALLFMGMLTGCGGDAALNDPVLLAPADDIYTALQQGDVQRARYFIETEQWDHGVMDANGKLPLEYAVEMGNAELVTLMVQKGAYIHAETRDGKNMAQLAREKGHEQIAAMFQQSGVQP